MSIVVDSMGLWRDGACSVGFWEADIQKALVDALLPSAGLVVLEIGYGLGLAHREIRRRSPRWHLVIESDAQLAPHQAPPELSVWPGLRWQGGTERLPDARFDAITFDPDPELPADLGWTPDRVRDWAWSGASRLWGKLAAGGRFGFLDFTGQALDDDDFRAELTALGASTLRIRKHMKPPTSCRYASEGWAEVIVLEQGRTGAC